MDEVYWQIGIPTGNLAASFRGIRMVIKLDTKGEPKEIGWFIGGVLAQSVSVDCDLENTKKLGMAVIDQKISMDERWQTAEAKELRAEVRLSHEWGNAKSKPHFEQAPGESLN
jgi:hypothetical protein